MNESGSENRNDEMREEYDFSNLERVDRNAFFERLMRERGARILKPEMAEKFPDDESLDEALKDYLKLKRESA